MATLSTSLMPPPARAISSPAPGPATKPAHSTTPSARSSTAANPTLSNTASARSSATASAAATIPSALRALVKWAQYLVQHRAQELSLAELERQIQALSPLAHPICYRYQIALAPHQCQVAQVKLLDSGQVELSVYAPSMVSLEGPLPLELLQELNLQVQDGQTSLNDFIRLLTERFSQLYAHCANLASGQSVHHALWYEQLSLALLGAHHDFTYQLPPELLRGALSALGALDQGSAHSLERVLKQALGCPVQVVERVFALYPLPQELQTCLGQRNSTLGQDTMLGAHYPSSQRRFALILDPITYPQLVALRKQQGSRALPLLLALALGERCLECVVEYRLRPEHAQAISLNGTCALGQGTILCSPHQEVRTQENEPYWSGQTIIHFNSSTNFQ